MFAISTLALCSLACNPCDSRCYLLVFGGQGEKYRPRTSHTWATFVRATPAGLESFTISWLPVELPVQPLRLRPGPGRNYGLHETLDLFTTGKHEIGLWGPYEIRGDWYDEACRHKLCLDSGAIAFNTLDRGPVLPNRVTRHPDISHCVHAVTRTNTGLMLSINPVFTYGDLITRKVVDRMNDTHLLVNPATTNDWLIPALDVQRFPLVRRHLDEPLLAIMR